LSHAEAEAPEAEAGAGVGVEAEAGAEDHAPGDVLANSPWLPWLAVISGSSAKRKV